MAKIMILKLNFKNIFISKRKKEELLQAELYKHDKSYANKNGSL